MSTSIWTRSSFCRLLLVVVFRFDKFGESDVWRKPIIRVVVHPPKPQPDQDYPKDEVARRAQAIINREKPKINAFCDQHRQQVKISGTRYYSVTQRFNQVAVRYIFSINREILALDVYPAPVRVVEEGLMLLIFYEGNKIAAIPMKDIKGITADHPPLTLSSKYAAELKKSDWGDDLLKVSQYKFNEDDGGVLLSPLRIVDSKVTSAETHYFASAKQKFETFVASSTRAKRTPLINGVKTTYYTSNDVFAFRKGKPVYVGAGGNGETPVAITADGIYYYKPNISTEWFSLHSYEAQELQWMGDLKSDEELDAVATALESAYPSFIGAPRAPFMPRADYEAITLNTFTGGGGGWGALISGTYVVTHNYATTGDVAAGRPALQTNVSTVMPMNIFSQIKKLDVLTVHLEGVGATYSESGLSATSISVTAQVLNLDYSAAKPPGSWPRTTVTSPHINESDPFGTYILDSHPAFRAWVINYPPSFGIEDGKYFFAHTDTLFTPYGSWPYTISYPKNGHYLIVRDEYTPWLHLSNGEVVVQAFELQGTRKVFAQQVDITDLIATACDTSIDDIQAMIIDFPLAKARQLK